VLSQENITCSIGVGPNKVVAKIASDQSKPDGLVIVKPEEVTDFLSPLPVNRIPGVGIKAEEKLGTLNVSTIAQLSNMSANVLVETFGKSLGGYLYGASKGEDDDPVKERGQPTQFSRIATLKQNTRSPEETFSLLKELSESVAGKLRELGLKCKSVAIIAILTDLSLHSKSHSLDAPTSDENLIEATAKQLIQEFLAADPQAVLRRVGVKVTGLGKAAGQTDISKFLHT
jgi:DNA polymerase IV (DinB-like DNA polymerase)